MIVNTDRDRQGHHRSDGAGGGVRSDQMLIAWANQKSIRCTQLHLMMQINPTYGPSRSTRRWSASSSSHGNHLMHIPAFTLAQNGESQKSSLEEWRINSSVGVLSVLSGNWTNKSARKNEALLYGKTYPHIVHSTSSGHATIQSLCGWEFYNPLFVNSTIQSESAFRSQMENILVLIKHWEYSLHDRFFSVLPRLKTCELSLLLIP